MNELKNPKMDDTSIVSQAKHIYLTVTDRCYRAEHLLSLYMDGQLSQRLADEVEKHIDTCASCRAAKSVMLATHQVLSRREAVQPPAYLSERLRQAIAMEAAQQPVTKPRAFALAPRLLLAGTSAAAIVVFSLILFHHNPAPQMTTSNRAAVNVANSGVSHKLSIGLRHNSSPNVSTHPYFVAVLPHSIDSTTESLRLSLPVHAVAKQYSRKQSVESNGASLTHPLEQVAKTTAHSLPLRTVTHEALIAALPKPGAPSAASSTGPTGEVSPATTPGQPVGSVNVADNPEQSVHGNLYNRLRLSSLNTATTEDSFVQLDQSRVRLTSYVPPGAQLEGSKIDN